MRSVKLLTGAVSGGISDRWYVATEDGSVGPVSIELLARGIASGKVPLDCQVRNESWTVWCPLSDIALVTVAPPPPATDEVPTAQFRGNAAVQLPALTWTGPPPAEAQALRETRLPPPPDTIDTVEEPHGQSFDDAAPRSRLADGSEPAARSSEGSEPAARSSDDSGPEASLSDDSEPDTRPTLPHIPAWMAGPPSEPGRDSRPTLPRYVPTATYRS
ncbi:DUF4339 domain-containing protein [Chondromyces crocatus]|uniref:GYF domain-containing protein n=1 Tax=Chondromyces crocatus TaxID=52 RepID=A0A0K1E5Q7_CHOCO|nr:DUF4339 domain-containing protein [Chondromyces crocatus]AKT35908.1 uncharacterized protein CMC5_000190 [Chondromyces crocatus]